MHYMEGDEEYGEGQPVGQMLSMEEIQQCFGMNNLKGIIILDSGTSHTIVGRHNLPEGQRTEEIKPITFQNWLAAARGRWRRE